MHIREPDTALVALDDSSLKARLARTDWKCDPLFITDEQVIGLFNEARAKGDRVRTSLYAEAFNLRLLERSRKFVLKVHIYPGFIDDLSRATYELASCIWEHLLSSDKHAAHAEKAFGQFFDRRAIEFQRTFFAKKRALQSSLDSDDDEDEVVSTVDYIDELKEFSTPDLLAARRQDFERANSRLLGILTPNEYATYVLMYACDWQVQEVAAMLEVSVKSVNNYKRSALSKIDKEFKQ